MISGRLIVGLFEPSHSSKNVTMQFNKKGGSMLSNFIKTACNTVIVMLAFLFVTSICSAEVEKGLFIGGSIGQAFSASEIPEYDEYEFNGSSLGYRFFAGWRPFSLLAFEMGYRNFGEIEDGYELQLIETETTAWDGFLVGMIPIGPVDIFAKGGFARWNAEYSIGPLSGSTDGTNFTWGAGVALRIKKLSIRLEWEKIESAYSSNARLGMLSLGASYTF